MSRLRFLIILAVVIALAAPTAAQAAIYVSSKGMWYDDQWVHNDYPSQRGVQADVYVSNRFGREEHNRITMIDPNASRSDGDDVGLSWELAQFSGDANFYPFVHVRYASGDGYSDRIYYYWDDPTSSGDWHNMKIWYAGSGRWRTYIDGDQFEDVYWSHLSGVESESAFEGFETSNNYSDWPGTGGHADDIYFRDSSGNWRLQDTSWADYMRGGTTIGTLNTLYSRSYTSRYYHWLMDKD